MSKRIYNILGSIFLMAAMLIAVGNFNGPGRDLIVFLSATGIAGISIILFWFGGWTCSRYQSKSD